MREIAREIVKHSLETPPNISYNRNVWTIFVIEQFEYLRGIVRKYYLLRNGE